MTEDFIIHFGCRRHAGHRLTRPNGSVVDTRYPRDQSLLVPGLLDLDASPIFLPYPERVGEGALTYLPANDRTVLAWWGSPYDARCRVNQAVIVPGRRTFDEVWDRFTREFADLAEVPRPSLTTDPNGVPYILDQARYWLSRIDTRDPDLRRLLVERNLFVVDAVERQRYDDLFARSVDQSCPTMG